MEETGPAWRTAMLIRLRNDLATGGGTRGRSKTQTISATRPVSERDKRRAEAIRAKIGRLGATMAYDPRSTTGDHGPLSLGKRRLIANYERRQARLDRLVAKANDLDPPTPSK